MNGVTADLRELLREVAKKKTLAEIGTAAGLEAKSPGQAVNDALHRGNSISYQLANYVLNETLLSGNVVDRAMFHLKSAGLADSELQAIRAVVENFTARIPAPTKAPASAEPPFQPLEKRAKRVNRREELPEYKIESKPGKNVVQIPRFEAVAAGFGEDLERSDDITYVRALPDWRDVHSVIVRGDSMEETLRPKDLILVRALHGGEGLTLEGLQHGEAKTPVKQIQRYIPDDEIFVLAIGSEAPTVKRIEYHIPAENPTDWHLLIKPDNPDYKVRVLGRSTPVRFFGQVLGIGNKQYVKR